MTYRLRNILVAVVLAVLAAFLTALYVANYQNRVDAGQENVKVLVASADIAPGTPAAALEGKVSEKEVLRKDLVPAALLELGSVDGQTTSQWIYSGEQVSARRFSTARQVGVLGDLKGNQRAVQVAGDEHQLLAGTVKAGDFVDVVANLKVSDQAHASRTILRELKVLKAPGGTGIDSQLAASGRNRGFYVVLQVTDAQAQKLFFVTSNDDHSWTLELRPVVDAADSPESLSTLPSVLRDGLPGNQAGSTGGN